MSRKKSLGHNPLGFSGFDQSSLNFIGSKPDQHHSDTHKNHQHDGNKHVEKKVVSYYLEVKLVHRLKDIAHSEGRYYSSLVSEAVENLIDEYEY